MITIRLAKTKEPRILIVKKGEAISTKTLDALCYALDCEVDDILKFVKE